MEFFSKEILLSKFFLPDTNIRNDSTAVEQSRPHVIYNQCLNTPMRMENSKGAEKGVSCRSGPHEWDDACGNLKQYIYVTNFQFTHSMKVVPIQ